MSTLTSSAASSWNSGQVQDFSTSPSLVIENDQRSSRVRGVGPADSTGKSSVRYCPGGTRPSTPADDGRRRRKPRDIGLVTAPCYGATPSSRRETSRLDKPGKVADCPHMGVMSGSDAHRLRNISARRKLSGRVARILASSRRVTAIMVHLMGAQML